MTRNVGPEDRVVRIAVAVGVAILIAAGILGGTEAIVAGIVAAYLLVSGLASRCVLYKLAGLDTSVHEQSYTSTDERSGL